MATVFLIISAIFLASPKMIVTGDINQGGYAAIYSSKGFKLLLEASMYCAMIPVFVLLGVELAWYWKTLICIAAYWLCIPLLSGIIHMLFARALRGGALTALMSMTIGVTALIIGLYI